MDYAPTMEELSRSGWLNPYTGEPLEEYMLQKKIWPDGMEYHDHIVFLSRRQQLAERRGDLDTAESAHLKKMEWIDSISSYGRRGEYLYCYGDPPSRRECKSRTGG